MGKESWLMASCSLSTYGVFMTTPVVIYVLEVLYATG